MACAWHVCVQVCREIAVAVEAAGAPPPAADELVPLVAYVLIVAQVTRTLTP